MKSPFSAVQIYRILCFFRFTVGSAFHSSCADRLDIRYAHGKRQTVVSYSRNLLQLFHRVHLIEMKVDEKKRRNKRFCWNETNKAKSLNNSETGMFADRNK